MHFFLLLLLLLLLLLVSCSCASSIALASHMQCICGTFYLLLPSLSLFGSTEHKLLSSSNLFLSVTLHFIYALCSHSLRPAQMCYPCKCIGRILSTQMLERDRDRDIYKKVSHFITRRPLCFASASLNSVHVTGLIIRMPSRTPR